MAKRENLPSTGDEVSVGGVQGVVRGAVGVAGGWEVTVVVADESGRGVDAGQPDSAKFGVQNTVGPAEELALNAERYEESAKANAEADKEEEAAQSELSSLASDTEGDNASNSDDKDSAGAKTSVNSVSGGTPSKTQVASAKSTAATNEKLAADKK